jgi:two-component system response regulator
MKTILLVEDNESDELLTTHALNQARLADTIDVVRDGQEALDYLFARGAHAGRDPRQLPTLVLLDLALPRLDGLDVLKAIRADERTQRLPVVVLTSSNEQEDIVRSYDLGANAYVRKPVDFTQFTQTIGTLGLFWIVLNEAPPARPT